MYAEKRTVAPVGLYRIDRCREYPCGNVRCQPSAPRYFAAPDRGSRREQDDDERIGKSGIVVQMHDLRGAKPEDACN